MEALGGTGWRWVALGGAGWRWVAAGMKLSGGGDVSSGKSRGLPLPPPQLTSLLSLPLLPLLLPLPLPPA